MLDFLEAFDLEKSVIVTVGLVLPPGQLEAAISLSHQICDKDTCSFVLDERHNLPRVRLYETVFPVDQVETVHERIRQLSTAMIAFSMNWGEIEVTNHFVTVWGEINEPLRLFQEAVVETVSPLRHGFFKQKYAGSPLILNSQEKLSIEKWGSPWARPYAPHMIIAKAENTFASIPSLFDWEYRRSHFSEVIVATKDKKHIISSQRYTFHDTQPAE